VCCCSSRRRCILEHNADCEHLAHPSNFLQAPARHAFRLGLQGPARTRRLGTAALLPPAWLLTAKRSTLALANGDALDAAQSRQANVTPPALLSVKQVALLPPRPWPCVRRRPQLATLHSWAAFTQHTARPGSSGWRAAAGSGQASCGSARQARRAKTADYAGASAAGLPGARSRSAQQPGPRRRARTAAQNAEADCW